MRLTWLLFLPLILAPASPFKGLALADPTHGEDLQALGATWWYSWDTTGNVPMLWSGKPSTALPYDYAGWVLVLNEPNVATQSNLTPAQAVVRLNALRAYYPRARLICCGVSIWAGDWMREFWRLGGRPDAWHVHAYTEWYVTTLYIQTELAAWHRLTGGEYWVTEYGSPEGDLEDFKAITEWFEAQPWIVRIAAYTNRQDRSQPWALAPGVELVNPDGSLSPIGQYYSGR